MNRGLVLLVGILLSASSSFAQTKAGSVRIEGSSSMAPCTERLAEWYHNNHAEASFVVSRGGPDKGIAALVEAKAEIAQSTRQVLGGEILSLRDRRGAKFIQVPVATEVAGILVHPSNPIHELSIFDLRQILSGAVKNWKQVGGYDSPIKIYGRDQSSDSKEFIEAEFMGDEGISPAQPPIPRIPNCTLRYLGIREASATAA